MAFISNKERAHLVKKTNKSYTGRKICFFVITALTLLWLVLIVLFSILGQKDNENLKFWDKENNTLTTAGFIYAIITFLLVFAEIIMVILMLSIISPRDTTKTTRKLQSSALSGVKIKHKRNLDKVAAVKARSQAKPKKHKKK